MSVVQYPETMSSNDVQMWDNAVFDNGADSETSNALKVSWSNMNPLSSINLSHQSFDSDCTKENINPSSFHSPVSIKSLASNTLPKSVSKMSVSEKKRNGVLDERNLDSEIEEIEKEISRLSSKLKDLRLEKLKKNTKVTEKRGRIVAAKFMNPPKQVIRSSNEERKIEESMNMSGKLKTPRRGMSLGPAEIMREMKRGISLGPMEIYSATKLKNLSKQENTLVQQSENRRKSCYWKIQDIDELRVTKQRGKSMSVSPKSRSKTVNKPQIPKQASTTIGAKRLMKKENGVISSIEPKKLFVKDEKTLKSGGRLVASRYNVITSGGSCALKELRKRSLDENEEKKRVSLVVKCEGDGEIVKVVPRIKTCRCTIESPRDSGPAKRVSELDGKKSFFSEDDENVCQDLSFEKEEEEETTKECLKIRVVSSMNEAKRVSQLDDEEEMPVFSFEEEDVEENCMETEDILL